MRLIQQQHLYIDAFMHNSATRIWCITCIIARRLIQHLWVKCIHLCVVVGRKHAVCPNAAERRTLDTMRWRTRNRKDGKIYVARVCV